MRACCCSKRAADRDPWIRIPLGWGRILTRLHDWMYFTEPEANADGRRIECARGKVVGGSSSINAMAYVRGHRGDYDRWAAAGLPHWSYAHVLPYFRRQETWEGGAGPYRGGDGPLDVAHRALRRPARRRLPRGRRGAAATRSPPTTTARSRKASAACSMTIRDGRRCSAAEAYLRPALARPQPHGRDRRAGHRASCSRAGRAVGVEYREGRRDARARAEREVILARRRHQLAAAPDAVRHRRPGRARARTASRSRSTLPGVGQESAGPHLRRRRLSGAREPGPLIARMRLDRIGARAGRGLLLRHRASPAESPSGVMAFLKTPARGGNARHPVPVPRRADDGRPLSAAVRAGLSPTAFACRAVVLRPESRGEIDPRLGRSARAAAHPAEFPRHREATGQRCAPGCGWCARSARQPPLSAVRRAARSRPAPASRVGRRARRPYPRHRDHRAPPARHLQDGPGRRPDGGGRSRAAGARRRRACASSTPR